MHAYTCALKTGEVTLKEHVAAQWLAAEELGQLNWAAADVPVVNLLKNV
jgi:8-oxo-dGTP diphosphatase